MADKYVDRAFRIIRRNYGCPGPDDLSLKSVKANYQRYRKTIVNYFNNNHTQVCAPRLKTFLDERNKVRNIYIYSVLDRWLQQAIRLAIEPYIESVLQPYVFAYRKGRDFFSLIEYMQETHPKAILWTDIVNFTDNIDKSILNRKLKSIGVPKKYMKAINNSIHHLSRGIPAGNCLTPMLSNLYLIDVDMHYVDGYSRFSDDMFFCIENESYVERIERNLKKILDPLKLQINPDKTSVISRPDTMQNNAHKFGLMDL